MTHPSTVWYVYGVARSPIDLAQAPDGVDDASVESCVDGELAAIASRLDGATYAPAAVERATEDVEWLAPRAVAHDRVLTWVSDHRPVVPFPIFSLFSGQAAVRKMLHERRAELHAALQRASMGREYALRVYRIDSELAVAATELSPRLAQLQDAAAAASPGQRYLLERKLETERKNELQLIGNRIARDVIEALRPLAVETSESRVTTSNAGGKPAGMLILDAAFLVDPRGFEAFQRQLTDIVNRHNARGFRFDFTGPWPVYHFVQNREQAATDA